MQGQEVNIFTGNVSLRRKIAAPGEIILTTPLESLQTSPQFPQEVESVDYQGVADLLALDQPGDLVQPKEDDLDVLKRIELRPGG